MARNIALRYAADGYVASGKAMLGRRVAGDSFLNGLLKHGRLAKLVSLAHGDKDAAGCVAEISRRKPGLIMEVARLDNPQAVADAGVLYLPGPGLAEHAMWRKWHGNQRAFSLCGITHTTATARVMGALADAVSAPVQRWDAIVCTSRAVQGMVRRQLDARGEYLRSTLGATQVADPILPVIPLGVECGNFVIDEATGKLFRAHLGIGPEDIAVLVVARLSVATKFSPLPLYLALQKAARDSGRKFHVLLTGWLDRDSHQAFLGAGKSVCPDVGIHLVNGQDEQVRLNARSAADIFTLPVDNVQETFGLAPVEAMAAGLPVVATDWDGFRDTIVHGETGFLVPTAMGGDGRELSMRYHLGIDSYESYMRGVAQCVAMDINAAAEAFTLLAKDRDLRRKMGYSARERARLKYDWAAVIPQYLQLWEEQDRLRAAEPEFSPLGETSHGVYPDPFDLFADYPSKIASASTIVGIATDDAPAKVRKLASIPGAVGRGTQLPALSALDAILDLVAKGPVSIEEIAVKCMDGNVPRATAGVSWLAKLGVVSLQS